MKLSNKPYKTFGALRLAFAASPAGVALHALLTALQAVTPTAFMALATAGFVDTAAAILRGARPRGDIYAPLLFLILVIGVNATVGTVISLVSARIRLSLQQKLLPATVRIHASMDYKHIENAATQELISRVTRDPVKSVTDGFGSLLQLSNIFIGVAAVLILIVTNIWWAALVIVAFSAPMFWLSVRAGKKNYQAGRDAEKFKRRYEYLGEVLSGRDSVDERTLFGYGGEINRRWREQYEAGRKLQLKVNARMFVMIKSSSMLLALISVLIALTLIGPVLTGGLTAGMYMGIVNAVFGMINMLGWSLTHALDNITRAGEYMKDLNAFIRLGEPEGNNEKMREGVVPGDGAGAGGDGAPCEPTIKPSSAVGTHCEPAPGPSSAGSALCEPAPEPVPFFGLEFVNVRFKYPSGDQYVLDGLSFRLEGGRHYAFVGRNGAGKTTITKLLTGLYTEYDGEILINGRELRTYAAGDVKAIFSVVYQDFAKYYIPLADNILIGDAARLYISDVARLSEILDIAGLNETAGGLKDGVNTPLGKIKEDGQDISGGEWQKVAIARSLISRAPVKILDEPTAALDPVSESRVYGEFEALMRGKTTIFISHRLGSTKLADEILVIDGGRVTERGAHDSLMEADGLYAEMFDSQRSWYL